MTLWLAVLIGFVLGGLATSWALSLVVVVRAARNGSGHAET